MTKDMVMRLLTELARDNMVVRESWVRENAHEAAAMFKRLEVQIPAIIIATLHERGLELLRQSPILAVEYSSPASEMQRLETRRTIARDISRRLALLPKLRDLLESLSIPKQLRVLHPAAAERLGYRPALRALCEVNPSTLAQKIPEHEELQKDWVSAVQYWCIAFDRAYQPIRHIDWIVSNVHYGYADRAGQIADMIVGGRDINPRWSFTRAYHEAEQWHRDLAMKSEEETFLLRYGVAFDHRIDYAPLPNEWRFNDLDFVALRSGKDLFDEGRTMHHCVASYARHIVSGQSRIYSVRRNGKPLATFELGVRSASRGTGLRSWRPMQLQGQCNNPVSDDVLGAVQRFLDSYRQQWRKRELTRAELRTSSSLEPYETQTFPLIEGTFNSSGRNAFDELARMDAQQWQNELRSQMLQNIGPIGQGIMQFGVNPAGDPTLETLTEEQLLATAQRMDALTRATFNAIEQEQQGINQQPVSWWNVPIRRDDLIVSGDITP